MPVLCSDKIFDFRYFSTYFSAFLINKSYPWLALAAAMILSSELRLSSSGR